MMNPSCTSEPADKKYIFYDYIDKYLEYERSCYQDTKCNKYYEICKSIGISADGKQDVRSNICVRFHYLIEEIIKSTSTSNESTEYADLAFLNYWLNYELHNKKADIRPREFHQHMKVHNKNTNTKLSKLNGKMYYIDEDEVKNMYSLFYLYMDYINIKNSVISDNPSEYLFRSYTKHCVDKYQELEDKCLKEKSSFCKALCDFKKKYEKINLIDDIKNDWSYNSLPPLSKYGQIVEKVPQSPSHGDSSTLLQGSCRESVGGNVLTPCNNSDIGSKSLEFDDVSAALPFVASAEVSEASTHVNKPSIPHRSESLGDTRVISYMYGQDSSVNNEPIEMKGENNFDTSINKIIGTSISTIGVSSLFFLFYKFTSLGSRFRSQNKGKKYIRNNFDQQSNNFLDTSEYQYIPEENMSYNISYNSV